MLTVTATALLSTVPGTNLTSLTGSIRCLATDGSGSTIDRPFEIELSYSARDIHDEPSRAVFHLRTPVFEQAIFAMDIDEGNLVFHGDRVRINEFDAAILVIEFDFDSSVRN